MGKGNVGDRIVITKVNEHLRGTTPDVGVCGKVVDLDFEGVVIKPEDEDETYYIYDDEYELVDTEKNLYGEVIQWEVGQEVWCLAKGKGVVRAIDYAWDFPINILFESGFEDSYTREGKRLQQDADRSLYFSEPKITAETMPPEKPFKPALTKGDIVFAEYADKVFKIVVKQETRESVISSQDLTFTKKSCILYKVGEQVKFN